MAQSELNRLRKEGLALQLAADDMLQAEAAARALSSEARDRNLMLALETAMAVCYSRAFTQSNLMTLPDEHVPSTSPDAELHKWLRDRRDQAYAHKDKKQKSGRDASVKMLEGEPIEWRLEWLPFPRKWIEPALNLFERQRERFRADAVRIQQEIEAFGQRSGSDG